MHAQAVWFLVGAAMLWSFARKPDLAENHGVNLEGALTWAFEFRIDEEHSNAFRV